MSITLGEGGEFWVDNYPQTVDYEEPEDELWVDNDLKDITYEPAPGIYIGTRGGASGFEYQMPVSQTTALFEHDLGRDPVAIMVSVDGEVFDEYSVSFPEPGVSVLVGFDMSVRALIRVL